MTRNEQARELREKEIADLITMVNEGGIPLDSATLAVMSRYVEGSVGLTHVSLALAELRRRTDGRTVSS